jgi:hypothetical protein
LPKEGSSPSDGSTVTVPTKSNMREGAMTVYRFVTIAVVALAMCASPAAAQGPKVTVVNPPSSPVPVTGTVAVLPSTPSTFFARLDATANPNPETQSFVLPSNAFLKVLDIHVPEQTAGGCNVGITRDTDFLINRIFLDDKPSELASANAANINLGPGIEFSAGQELRMQVGIGAEPVGKCRAVVVAVFEGRP